MRARYKHIPSNNSDFGSQVHILCKLILLSLSPLLNHAFLSRILGADRNYLRLSQTHTSETTVLHLCKHPYIQRRSSPTLEKFRGHSCRIWYLIPPLPMHCAVARGVHPRQAYNDSSLARMWPRNTHDILALGGLPGQLPTRTAVPSRSVPTASPVSGRLNHARRYGTSSCL